MATNFDNVDLEAFGEIWHDFVVALPNSHLRRDKYEWYAIVWAYNVVERYGPGTKLLFGEPRGLDGGVCYVAGKVLVWICVHWLHYTASSLAGYKPMKIWYGKRMSEASLPGAQAALASLREDGNYFGTTPVAPQTIGGVTYLHPTEGNRSVAADPRVLRAIGHLYAADETLRRVVQATGPRTSSLHAAADFVNQMYSQPRLVWGVSGFASIGPSCGLQADGLERLYRYLSNEHRRPVMVTDGGSGAGVLAISAVLAGACSIQTLGVSPLQGLSSMSPRNRMVVYGDTYENREVIVGLLPDVLVVFDGGKGSMGEAIAAVKAGVRVLLVSQTGNNRDPKLLINMWRADPHLALAVREKRMTICKSVDDIPAYAEAHRAIAVRTARSFRPSRLAVIRRRFGV